MPRYYFHVDDGAGHTDDDGHELPDIATAKCEAVKYAGDLICEAHATFWDRGDWQMTVSDDDGLTLFTLIFAGYDAPATVAA
ncbi:MAG TPA: hypothetical protein VM900_01065 [Sphingomonas sp.]|nr:hypothetical protein [Sphingomonas sp.]